MTQNKDTQDRLTIFPVKGKATVLKIRALQRKMKLNEYLVWCSDRVEKEVKS